MKVQVQKNSVGLLQIQIPMRTQGKGNGRNNTVSEFFCFSWLNSHLSYLELIFS